MFVIRERLHAHSVYTYMDNELYKIHGTYIKIKNIKSFYVI